MTVPLDCRPARHPDVASRIFEDEAVLVDSHHNMVRMLNPVGSRIWELVDGRLSLEQIAAQLVIEYDVEYPQAHHNVIAFIDMLHSKGLVIVTPGL